MTTDDAGGGVAPGGSAAGLRVWAGGVDRASATGDGTGTGVGTGRGSAVADSGTGDDGAGAAAAAGGADWPCERRAADFVMSREPQPGQVTMLSGLDSGPMAVLQRGQFIVDRGASIT